MEDQAHQTGGETICYLIIFNNIEIATAFDLQYVSRYGAQCSMFMSLQLLLIYHYSTDIFNLQVCTFDIYLTHFWQIFRQIIAIYLDTYFQYILKDIWPIFSICRCAPLPYICHIVWQIFEIFWKIFDRYFEYAGAHLSRQTQGPSRTISPITRDLRNLTTWLQLGNW